LGRPILRNRSARRGDLAAGQRPIGQVARSTDRRNPAIRELRVLPNRNVHPTSSALAGATRGRRHGACSRRRRPKPAPQTGRLGGMHALRMVDRRYGEAGPPWLVDAIVQCHGAGDARRRPQSESRGRPQERPAAAAGQAKRLGCQHRDEAQLGREGDPEFGVLSQLRASLRGGYAK
jgi:hypothetical protein